MTRNLRNSLKELQILLGKPSRNIAGAFRSYLNLLNPSLGKEEEKKVNHSFVQNKSVTYKKVTWVDIINPDRASISKLAQNYPFHPLHLEDCISKGQFPKIEQNNEDKYLFVLLRFPRYKSQGEKVIINQICFFLGKDYLVTIHEDPKDAISHVFNESIQGEEQKKVYINGSSTHLFYVILDQLTKDLYPLSQAILQEVDEVEDVVFDDKSSAVFQVGQLRQKIIGLRRIIRPLRTLATDLEQKISSLSTIDMSVYLENIIHRVERTWETLEEARETVEIYKDADFTFSTEKTNKILSVLTIIFTLSIPATVVGTFYGMNIVLPGGVEAGAWTFWGPYSTLFVIFIAAIIPALLMYSYFRRRGWF